MAKSPLDNVEVRKAVRTVVQVALGIATAVPEIVSHVPSAAWLPQVAVVAGVAANYFYALEKIPGFPAWLKVASAVPATPVPNNQ